MNNKTLIWTLAIIAVLIGGMFAIRLAQDSNTISSGSDLYTPVGEGDHIRGTGNITLVEYSDFQCPACGIYYPAVKQLEEDFVGDLRIVYRHFPLSQHLNAKPAAYAAEAASLQGKFFEMHDMIFETQKEWENTTNAKEIFRTYAVKLGLDMAKFDIDVESNEVKEKVESDYQGGVKSKVNATPSFYLNGKKIQNPRDYAEFQSIIQNAKTN